MEKDIGKIAKNESTDVIVRIDDFGGKVGLTIREFVNDSKTGYKGFTKAGTRIAAEKFLEFRELINSIKLEDLKSDGSEPAGAGSEKHKAKKAASMDDY